MIYVTHVSEIGKISAEFSKYRHEKTARRKSDADKLLSTAAGLLLNYGLKKRGLLEKDMEYGENEHGKPYFKNHENIKFSISHSGEYAACAFSEREVGIDIEMSKNGADIFKIAKRYFTENEYTYIENAKNSEAAFFKLWTRKESLLKALGTGISAGLGKFETLDDTLVIDGRKFCFSEFSVADKVMVTCCSEGEAENEIRYLSRADF